MLAVRKGAGLGVVERILAATDGAAAAVVGRKGALPLQCVTIKTPEAVIMALLRAHPAAARFQLARNQGCKLWLLEYVLYRGLSAAAAAAVYEAHPSAAEELELRTTSTTTVELAQSLLGPATADPQILAAAAKILKGALTLQKGLAHSDFKVLRSFSSCPTAQRCVPVARLLNCNTQ